MRHPFCPHPTVLQRWCAGPLGASRAAFVQPLLDQGDAPSTAQYMLRLLADRSSWLQRQALTATDRNAQCARDFLQDRSGRCRPHRNDRPVLRRLRKQLRDQGGIPGAVVAPTARTRSGIEGDVQHDLLHQRCLAPTPVASSLDTVRRCLDERFGIQPLRCEALCPLIRTQKGKK
jgi:hypothetical protein